MMDFEALKDQTRISCDDLYSHPAVRWFLGDSLHPGGLTLTRRLAEKMGLPRGSTVLDVASGCGATAKFLTEELGWNLIGIDLVMENLKQAGKRDGSAGYLRGDAEAIPVASESIDGVVCECSLSIFPNKSLAVSEMSRVLKPNGAIGVSDVTFEGELPEKLKNIFSRVACIADVKSPEEYCILLEGAGFRQINIEDHDEEMQALVESIRRKLAPLTLMIKLKALKISGVSSEMVSQGKELIGEVENLIGDRKLGYCLITAHKPESR